MGPAGEPMPVGRVQANWPHHGTAPHSYDQGVAQSNYAPSFTPMGDDKQSNPHVIMHVLGLSAIPKLFHRDAAAERAREKHAQITYGKRNGAVTELPASVVYGQK